MQLKTVFIRFYKSFNFDYLRKFHDSSRPLPWEMLDDTLWYPHVRIPIDKKITTIVGANESGKSHLLTAIEKGLSGQGIQREDFCRYSEFYSVAQGKWKWPDFGFEWTDLTDAERKVITDAAGLSSKVPERFFLFRTNREHLTLYLPSGEDYSRHDIKEDQHATITSVLPRLFRIAANVALPESVPIRYLAQSEGNQFSAMTRKRRFSFLDNVTGVLGHSDWFQSAQTVQQQAPSIASAMSALFTSSRQTQEDGTATNISEVDLAKKLIFDVAGIDKEAIGDLQRALNDGKDGHANGLIQKLNDHLAANLNFPKWWHQDKEVRLTVTSRDHDLVFTIRDRTGTEYSFGERSDGLRYFLSYYIQYRAHRPALDRYEILLMDEPDTYLSAQAQQDLLRIFDAFANPENKSRPIQVAYVTHSPFLIDKNHSDRIRVLEKGVGEEGTRVVRDASRNHYEPLRSAFGAFVGETAFIGNCNLMVEGPADQILFAGATSLLRASGAGSLETLDLNNLTIVPASSASQIPYLVYLARGRDIEQPSVIVCMDSDGAANTARKALKRGGAYGRQLLKDEYVLQIGELTAETGFPAPTTLVETEDLVPVPLAVEAGRQYAREICGAKDEAVLKITETEVQRHIDEGKTLYAAIQEVFSTLTADEIHLTKIGFARNVIEISLNVPRLSDGIGSPLLPAVQLFEARMRVLFRRLNAMRRSAERAETNERVSNRIGRAKKAFLQDHPASATREQVQMLFDDMTAVLDKNSIESDAVHAAMQRIRREFEIETDMTSPVPDFAKFRQALESIHYAPRHATQERDAEPPQTTADQSAKTVVASS